VKIRSGWDSASVNFLEIGRIAQEEGVDAVILHPRTRAQGFSGKADWSHIHRLKESLTIPVIGSGDIFCAQDALDMVSQTGCDGIMIGRGSYGNPWLLANILRLQAGETPCEPSPADRHAVIRDHLDLHLEHFGPRRTLGEIRKHLSWYSKGLPGSSGFRAAVNNTVDLSELRRVIDDFFSDATATA
jgi:nifR3 family TIM-barrel protein